MNKLVIFFFFLFVSCHDTGPDPIDNPDPIDTIPHINLDSLAAVNKIRGD